MFKINTLRHFFVTLALFFGIAHAHPPAATQDQSLSQWIEQAKSSIQKRTLANGITVLFYRLPNTVEVELRVTVNVGSRDEHEGQYGLAHMVEHMIFKGTDKMSENDIWRITDTFGNVQKNAYTSRDQTWYYFVTDNKNWPIFLSMLADSMQNTHFDQEHFDSEVKTVLSELNLGRGNVFDKSWSLLFPPHHPYARSVIGTREDLVNATAQDLKDFYHTHYTPEQTVITIVGNIDPDVALSKAEALFGAIPRSNKKEKPFVPDAFLPTDFIQKHLVIHTQAEKQTTRLLWLTPGSKNNQVEIGNFLEYCLNERLRKIKDELDLVYSYGANQAAFFDAGLFIIGFEPKENTTNKAIAIIHEELRDLTTNGPTEAELTKFKITEKNTFAQNCENIRFISSILNAYCINNNEYEAFNRFLYAQSFTGSTVKNFCKQYLKPTLIHHIDVIPLQEDEKTEWIELQEKIDAYEKKLTANKERTRPVDQEKLLHQLHPPEKLDFDFKKPDLVTTLSNGLPVYIKKQTTTPALYLSCGFKNDEHMFLYYAEQQQETIPTLSLAQLFEESNGTADHPEPFSKKEHLDFFDAIGAQSSFAFGDPSLCCMPHDFDAAAQRFFHILTQPTYPLKPFTIAIANSIDDIDKSQQSADHVAAKTLAHHLHRDAPWNYTDEERIEHLKKHTRDDLFAFHKAWINPNTMYIVLVGNIEPEEAQRKLETIFGSWHNQSTIADDQLNAITIPTITNPPADDVSMFVPDEQVILNAGRISTIKNTDDAHALLLLETYLNRQLFNIRQRTGMFYFCHAGLAPTSFITNDNTAITTTTMPHNIEAAKQAIKAVLVDVYQNGVTQEYLDTEKQCATMKLAKKFATSASIANAYGYLVSNNLSFDYFNQVLKKIDALTIDQVNAVAKKYLNPKDWSFVQAGRTTQHAAA